MLLQHYLKICSRPLLYSSVRYCLKKQFTNEEFISRLVKIYPERKKQAGEDIASYVRFNRDIKVAAASEFSELYSKDAHPDKTDHEREEIRLTIEQICAEYEYHLYINMRVPTTLSIEDMKELLERRLPETRQTFLIHFYRRDAIKLKDHVKKVVKRMGKQDKRETLPRPFTSGIFASNGDLHYGLWKNNLTIRNNYNYKQKIRSALNAQMLGPTLIFDWFFPIKLLDEKRQEYSQILNDDPLTNGIISERHYQTLAEYIYKICNENLKQVHSCRPTLNIVHYNLEKESKFSQYLQEGCKSEISKRFFNAHCRSYLDDFTDKQIIYINPFAEETLTQADLTHHPETVFVMNPFIDLFQLRRRCLKQIFHLKQISEEERNVKFRRLPAHMLTKPDVYVPSEHFINYLKDILEGSDWAEAFSNRIPRKYHNRSMLKFSFKDEQSGNDE